MLMKKKFIISLLVLLTTKAYTQWTWQNPLPQGNNLNSVFFIDSLSGWAVGEHGTILKYNKSKWDFL